MRHGRPSLEYKDLPFSLKAAATDTGEFEGLASAFFTIDDSWFSDIVAPGAFKQDLGEFLESGFVGGMNHDWDQPIGRPLSAEETAEGLFVKASISDTQQGRDVRTLIKDGVVKRLSIGFRVLGRKLLETSEEVVAWWNEHGYVPSAEDVAKSQFGARLLTRIRLYEFSPVAVPANRRAVITGVKGEGGGEEERARATPLALHSAAVAQAVGEYCERLQAVRELRGGAVSSDHLAGFRRLRADLDQLCMLLEGKSLEGKGDGKAAAGSGATSDGNRLYAEFLRREGLAILARVGRG